MVNGEIDKIGYVRYSDRATITNSLSYKTPNFVQKCHQEQLVDDWSIR